MAYWWVSQKNTVVLKGVIPRVKFTEYHGDPLFSVEIILDKGFKQAVEGRGVTLS